MQVRTCVPAYNSYAVVRGVARIFSKDTHYFPIPKSFLGALIKEVRLRCRPRQAEVETTPYALYHAACYLRAIFPLFL